MYACTLGIFTRIFTPLIAEIKIWWLQRLFAKRFLYSCTFYKTIKFNIKLNLVFVFFKYIYVYIIFLPYWHMHAPVRLRISSSRGTWPRQHQQQNHKVIDEDAKGEKRQFTTTINSCSVFPFILNLTASASWVSLSRTFKPTSHSAPK